MHSVLFPGELHVGLSGPIANPTTRHLHPCFAARSGRRSLHTGLCQCARTYKKNLSIFPTKESGLRRPPFPRVAVPVSALACAWSRTGVPEPSEDLPDHPLRNHYTTLPTLYILHMPTKYEPLRYTAPSGPGVERGISDER
jgi:hypothetical protein